MRSPGMGRRTGFLAAVACAFAVSIGAAGSTRGAPPPGSSLIWIDSADRDALRGLAGIGSPPVLVLDAGGFSLAWGDPAGIDAICAAGLDARPLAAARHDRTYAVVFLRDPKRAAPIVKLESLGEVLWTGPEHCVLAYPPIRDETLWQSYSILRIGDRPVRLGDPAGRPLPSARRDFDPAIEAYVAQVDPARLEATTQHLQDYGSRLSSSPLGREAGDWIADQFRRSGLGDVSLHDYNNWCDNVVAVQPGRTHPDEVYVLGAHYDSYSRSGVAPGADDNATGTAGVLETARILGTERFEATVIYIAFSGEEQGLVGSEAWATGAAARGLDIRGMVNLDMLGYRRDGDPVDLDIISNAESAVLRDLAFDVVTRYVSGIDPLDGYLAGGGSDHMSFWGHGYPAVFFHEDSDAHSPYIHTPQDVMGLSVNDMDLFTRSVRATVGMMATLARPLRVRIDHAALADPEPGGNGYPLRATIESMVPIREDSVGVYFRADGGAFRWIPLRRTGTGTDEFAATLPRQRAGTLVEYYLRGRDVEGRWAHVPHDAPARLHSFVVGRTVRFHDDVSEDLGWTTGVPEDDATSGRWERARPATGGPQPAMDASGDTSGVCFLTQPGMPGEDVGDSDVDGGRTTLLSPVFDLAGERGVTLDFDVWFANETHVDDVLRIELSNDGGGAWTLIDAITPAGRRWVRKAYAGLDSLAAPSAAMRVRFVAEDGGDPSVYEAAIDNVRIRSVPDVSEPPMADRNSIVATVPHPVRGAATIVYDLMEDAPVAFLVHDVAGRLIAELEPVAGGAGRHEVVWDGRTSSGEPAPSGHYWISMMRGASRVSVSRIVKVR